MVDKTAKHTEEAVGSGHPTKADTINRLALVEHNTDGTHKQPIPIPVGTKMLFYADTAPAGWTLDNTLDDKVVYVTKGSAAGGQTGGGAHSTGTWTQPGHQHAHAAFTLTANEIPAHTHTQRGSAQVAAGTVGSCYVGESANSINMGETATIGGGGSHTHPNAAAAATANTWRPASYAMIICSKN